jgi:hypothetical protein
MYKKNIQLGPNDDARRLSHVIQAPSFVIINFIPTARRSSQVNPDVETIVVIVCRGGESGESSSV